MSQDTTQAGSAEQPDEPLTVLVAEDFEDTRHLMRIELERRGFRIVEATNGEEAVAAALRERPETRETVIVAVTAHHESEYRAKALAAGCNAYVTKPIDFDWLRDLIDRLLP